MEKLSREIGDSMAKDQMIGSALLIASIVVGILYIYWLFFTPYFIWALIIPILLAVIGILAIIAWIGYTMATTPPPTPIEDIELDRKAEEGKAEEGKAGT